MGAYKFFFLLTLADAMVMHERGMSIKHPTAGFDNELYIPPSDEFAFQSSVWDTQEEFFGGKLFIL